MPLFLLHFRLTWINVHMYTNQIRRTGSHAAPWPHSRCSAPGSGKMQPGVSPWNPATDFDEASISWPARDQSKGQGLLCVPTIAPATATPQAPLHGPARALAPLNAHLAQVV